MFFLFLFLLTASQVSAQSIDTVNLPKQPAAEVDQGAIEFQGNLRLDNDLNPDENGDLKENLRTQRFELQASVRLAKNLPYRVMRDLRFVLRSKMEQNFIVNGQNAVNHIELPDYVKEAYLQLKNLADLPLDILIGSSEVSYGQDFRGTLDFQNDAAHAMTDPDQGQIKGLTLIFENDVAGLFDKIEATFFAPERNIRYASLNHFDAFAARVSKKFSENFEMQTSVLNKGNTYDPALLPETKVSVAVNYRSDPWTLWAEWIGMSHSENYPDAVQGGTGGVARLMAGGQVDAELTGIDKTLTQSALGYQNFITRNWTLGVTYRYTSCVGGNSGCVAVRGYGQGSSVDVAVRFGFGGDENENPKP